MARTIRDTKLETRSARLRLEARPRQVYWKTLLPAALHLGYRKKRADEPGKWLVRRYVGGERYRVTTLGTADDYSDDGTMTYAEAQRSAYAHNHGRPLHEVIAQKCVTFSDQNITPECYLYRHYDASGDPLYVGISLEPLRRHQKHLKQANWRDLIYQIIIEPFATREEALEAEQLAIRTEYPKHNVSYNGKRTTVEELVRMSRFARRVMKEPSPPEEQQSVPNIPDDKQAFTPAEFCARNNISLATFNKLKKTGYGPRLMVLSSSDRSVSTRISIEAERDWREAMEAYSEQRMPSPGGTRDEG